MEEKVLHSVFENQYLHIFTTVTLLEMLALPIFMEINAGLKKLLLLAFSLALKRLPLPGIRSLKFSIFNIIILLYFAYSYFFLLSANLYSY